MMKGSGPERLPFDLPMTEPVAEQMESKLGHRNAALAGASFEGVWPAWADRSAQWTEAYRRLGFELPPNGFIQGDGYAGQSAPRETLGSAWHLTHMLHPLEVVESVDQLEGLPWEDGSDPQVFSGLAHQVQAVHQRGLAAVLHQECTVFEHAWYRRGMDTLFMDLAEGNGIAEWLLDFYARRSAFAVAAAARAGVDCIRLGDDVGTQRGMMMSVPQWREVLKPRLAGVIQAAKQARPQAVIQYHSDGDIRPIIGDLVEIGVDLLNPVQPECMDMDEIAGEWGSRIGLSGMIGTQTTMPFGSPDDVREAVERVRRAAGRGIRVVLAPTHVLEPDVPWANIEALIEAAARPL